MTYPLLLVTAVGSAVGLSAHVNVLLTTSLVSLLAVGAIVLLERATPCRRAWSRSRDDVAGDLAFLLVSQAPVPHAFRLSLMGVLAGAGSRLSQGVGLSLWPGALPIVAQLALALVVAEFFQYWGHRLCHERPLFWRLHAMHHSVPRLYWLNAARFHPLETFTMYALQATPLVLLGAGERVIALYGFFLALNGTLRHTNIDMRCDGLNWILSTPDLHRWHHSRVPGEANGNYGANLIIWDVVFGTRRPFRRATEAPERGPAELGIAEPSAFPMGFLGQLASPFLARLWRGAERARRS